MGGVKDKYNQFMDSNWGWSFPINKGWHEAGGLDLPAGMSSGGGKGAKAPEPPDFLGAVREQGDIDLRNTRDQTAANRPDQYGPFGSSQWSQGPDGQWTQNVSLAPGLAQGAENLMGQIGSQGPVGTGDQARNQAIDSAYSQAASRLDPQWAQRETQTRSMLANQGLDPGSEAFGAEMGNFSRGRNDAYTSAMANAIDKGTAAGHLAFTDNILAANNPYQQLQSLQGLANPGGFISAGRNQAPDLMGAMGAGYSGSLNSYGINQANKNSQQQGLASLAALYASSASDERLKTNIQRSTLEAIPGVPFASWEWKDSPGERHYGVIAQDLEKVAPQYVHFRSDGMRMVDYSFLAR